MNFKSHNFYRDFVHFCKTEQLVQTSSDYLVAVSGGVDSVVLAHLCKTFGLNFSIAHCNFGLREQESDADEAFVTELAAQLSVQLHKIKFDTVAYKTSEAVGTQVAARNLRYNWFAGLQAAHNAEHNHKLILLTAHHADDHLETVIFNFFRGTGVQGLGGIAVKKTGIQRPLLFATKEQILEFAQEQNISYCEDASNATDDYTRNKIRHILLPAADSIFPNVKQRLAETIDRLQDAACIYEEAVQHKLSKIITIKGEEELLPVLYLEKMPAGKTFLYEWLKGKNFSSAQISEAWKLLQAETGKYILSPTHRLLKNRKWFILSPLQVQSQELVLIEEETKTVETKSGTLSISHHSILQNPTMGNSAVALDAGKLEFPLILRKWKAGDYFYPLGMAHKKKLNRFFSDNKFSLSDKENCLVLESNKKIIWVVGWRIDDRVKITSSTRHHLLLQWLPSK